MVPQVILSIVEGRGSDRSVLDTTRQLAERFDAHADIALLCPDPGQAVPYMSEGMTGDIIERLISEAEAMNAKRAKIARDEFQAWRKETGFALAVTRSDLAAVLESERLAPSCSWSEFTGPTDIFTATLGRLADLIVHSHGVSDDETGDEVSFQTALMECGRPVFLAPPDPCKTVGESIVVAWDGSAEAARAVGGAMPLLETAQSVTIVSIAEKRKDMVTTEGLARYLSWHGITANMRAVDAEGRTVGETLLDAAKQESADLLVMGAYGHNRYREWIFGGVTRHILDACTLPILLAH